jgi:hypothetical protein
VAILKLLEDSALQGWTDMHTARATRASRHACSVGTLRSELAVCHVPTFSIAALLISSWFKELQRRAITEGWQVRCLDPGGGIKKALDRIPSECVSEDIQRVFLHGYS